VTLADEQRSRLRRARLSSLVRDLGGEVPDGSITDTPALTAASDGGTAWAVTDDPGPGAVAAAVLWAERAGSGRLVLLVDDLAGSTARWAGWFDRDIEVRQVTGSTSRPVEAAPLPGPVPAVDDEALRAELTAAGLEVVVEHGVVRGEVLGLEVARLVVWPLELGGDGEVHLEAGVGRFDRDATAAMHAGESSTAALERATATVRAHRSPGAGTHPLALLARERWLRAAIVAEPALVGADRLVPVETTVPRASVRDTAPAAAAGRDDEGRPLVVVCSAGADLALVPVAADTRAAVDPDARLLLALPARDLLASTTRLAALLRRPAELVGLRAPWDDA
jgi:hypothetical protein